MRLIVCHSLISLKLEWLDSEQCLQVDLIAYTVMGSPS